MRAVSGSWAAEGRPLHDPLSASHHDPPQTSAPLPGNSNESTKALFKERLKCRTTPSFLFFRGGEHPTALFYKQQNYKNRWAPAEHACCAC